MVEVVNVGGGVQYMIIIDRRGEKEKEKKCKESFVQIWSQDFSFFSVTRLYNKGKKIKKKKKKKKSSEKWKVKRIFFESFLQFLFEILTR